MPCLDGRDEAVLYAADVDKLTRLLCGLCDRIEEYSTDAPLTAKHLLESSPELAEWWQKHKAADARERRRVEEEAARQKLLDSLTPEQRALLTGRR